MANFNLNKVILGGRLTDNPELKTTPSGISVCSFTIAVNRKFAKDGEQTTDFINVVAWRQTAEFISKYFSKGASICIVGSIQTRSYTTNDGSKRYITEVQADEAMFVDSKTEVDNARFSNAVDHVAPSAPTPEQTDIDEDFDQDLPF